MESLHSRRCSVPSPSLQFLNLGTTDALATVAVHFQVTAADGQQLHKRCLASLDIGGVTIDPSACFTVPSLSHPEHEAAVIAPIKLGPGKAKVRIQVRLDDDSTLHGEGDVDFQQRGMVSQQSREAAGLAIANC